MDESNKRKQDMNELTMTNGEAFRNVLKKKINELKDSQNNIQNVHTPYDLCDDMLTEMKQYTTFSDDEFLVLFNLEFVEMLIATGVPNERIWFVTDCKKKAALLGISRYSGVKVEVIDMQKNNAIEEMNPFGGKKFDAVVMNPPWQHQLHLSFLKKALDLGKMVVSVQPAGWFVCERKPKDVIDKISGKILSVKLFDGQPVFDVEIGCLAGIFLLDTTINKKSFTVVDESQHKSIEYDSVKNVNSFNNTDIYLPLKTKLLRLASQNSLFNNVGKQNKFYVNLAKIRGHGGNPDLHTFLPKSQGIEKTPKMQFFGFENKQSATNFISYLRTKVARFCLAILKSNKNMHQGELKSVPYVNCSQLWSDAFLVKQWELTKKEWEFIDSVIPNYYEEL